MTLRGGRRRSAHQFRPAQRSQRSGLAAPGVAIGLVVLLCCLFATNPSAAAADSIEIAAGTETEASADDGSTSATERDREFYTPITLADAESADAEEAESGDDMAADEAAPWEHFSITVGDLSMPTELAEMIQHLAVGYVQPHPELSVEDALRTALTHNHNLNSARLSAAAACQGIKVQWTDLMPQLSLQAKGYYQASNASTDPIEIPGPDDEPIEFDFAADADELQRQLALSLTQRIYDFGLTNDLIDVAESQHAIQKYTVDMTEQQLVSDVISAYFQFNLALGQARVRDDELTLARELLRQAEIQYEVGVVPRLDVIRAESRVEQARSAYIAAQSQVGDSGAYFFSLLGVEDDRYVPGLITAPLAEVGVPPPEIDEAINFTLENRPELELQYAVLETGEASKSLARNRPILQAYVNALYQKPTNFGQGTDSYEYGLQLMWNLYSGGSQKAKVKQEELKLKAIAEGILNLEAQLELDATTAWNRVVAARSSADAARKTLELTAEAHRAAAVGYSAGVTPYIDYLDALDQNVAAAIGYLTALAEVKLAQVNLARAMGFPYGYPGDGRALGPGDVDVFTALGLIDIGNWALEPENVDSAEPEE